MDENEKRRTLTGLREDRAEHLRKMKAIQAGAEVEGRDLSQNEGEAFDRLEKKYRAVDGKIAELEADLPSGGNLTRAHLNGGQTMIGADGVEHGASHRNGNDLRAQALNVNERANALPDTAREQVARTLEQDADPDSRLARYVIAAGDPAYKRAFLKWMQDPLSGHYSWTDQERGAYVHMTDEARALGIGTGGSGGFLTAYELDPNVVISGAGSIDPMRQLSRQVLTTWNEWRGVTSLGVTSSWDAEAAEVSDDSPTLVQPVIDCFKGQGFVPVSVELFEDQSDLGRQIQKLLLDSKIQLEAGAFATGTGSGQPKGIITAISAVGGSVVTSAGSSVALADIVANQNALPPRWRPNAKFMANLSIINQARQLPKGSGLTESVVDDSTNPPKILGWQTYENSNMDGTIAAGSTHDYCLLSGDFQNYVIADRVGTVIEFVPHLFGSNQRPTNQRGFLLHWRTGADAIVTDAFRLTDWSA